MHKELKVLQVIKELKVHKVVPKELKVHKERLVTKELRVHKVVP